MRSTSTLLSSLLVAAAVLGLSSCTNARLKRAVKQERGLKKVSFLHPAVHTRSCRGGRAHFEGERRDSTREAPERLCGVVCCDHGECRIHEYDHCGRSAPPR